MQNHIIICGLGHIGFQTFELLARMQQKMVLISNRMPEDWHGLVEEAGCVFLQGDARSDKLLIRAGIQEARCILVLTDQDLTNVAIIMDARKLNPNIRIIARMYDSELGQHIAEAFNVQQVFSTSELAAPIFTSSIYEESALAQFSIDHQSYIVSEKENMELDQTAYLLAGHKNRTSEILIATPVKRSPVQAHKNSLKKYFKPTIESLRYFGSPVFRNFRRVLTILFCVIVIATIFLEWQMNLPIIDALYFVTTTVTTVGYGDFNFSQSPPHLKLFGCLLMLSGAAALAILFSTITEILLSRKLQNLFGGRLVPRSGHVIVVGANQLGSRVIKDLLDENVPVVVLEDETTGQYTIDLKRQIAVIDGNPRSNETLERARIKHADALLTVMEDDVENLGVSLAAKKINENIITVTQIYDSQLSSKLHEEVSINRILSMSSVAVPYFVAAVFGEKILLALTWHDQLIFLSQSKTIPEIEGTHVILDEKHPDIWVSRIGLVGNKDN